MRITHSQKVNIIGSTVALTVFAPYIAGAVTLGHTLGVLSDLINGLIPIVLAITVLIFFWGLAMYLLDASNTERKGDGIRIMVMGVMALFVMVSIWGIIGVLQQTFKVDQAKPIVPDPIEQKQRRGTIF